MATQFHQILLLMSTLWTLNEACHIYEGVISEMKMSYKTHMNESWQHNLSRFCCWCQQCMPWWRPMCSAKWTRCVAVCCSVLQHVAVCCSVLQCFAVSCSVLQCLAVSCSVLQCLAACCSVSQYMAENQMDMRSSLHCVNITNSRSQNITNSYSSITNSRSHLDISRTQRVIWIYHELKKSSEYIKNSRIHVDSTNSYVNITNSRSHMNMSRTQEVIWIYRKLKDSSECHKLVLKHHKLKESCEYIMTSRTHLDISRIQTVLWILQTRMETSRTQRGYLNSTNSYGNITRRSHLNISRTQKVIWIYHELKESSESHKLGENRVPIGSCAVCERKCSLCVFAHTVWLNEEVPTHNPCVHYETSCSPGAFAFTPWLNERQCALTCVPWLSKTVPHTESCVHDVKEAVLRVHSHVRHDSMR